MPLIVPALTRLTRLTAIACTSALLAGGVSWVLAQPVAPQAASAASGPAAAPGSAMQRVRMPAPPAVEPTLVLEAREAWRKRDAQRLAAIKAMAIAGQHPLASWVDYWELNNRLATAQQTDLEAFYARWPGSYVEDRLRNDWLLELGRRRDWDNFRREYPRFRMNDDREVSCYALLTEHLTGRDVADAARAAWYAQRDVDDGCALLASTMHEARRFTQEDIWQAARLAMEFNRPRVARFAAALLGAKPMSVMSDVVDQPARYLARRASAATRTDAELTTLALMRMAYSDPDAAAGQLQRWQQALPQDLAAVAWAAVGKQAAFKLHPEAPAFYQQAWRFNPQRGTAAASWSDETLAWAVRAALRSAPAAERWPQVLRAIDAMTPTARQDNAWVYWRARAVAATAAAGSAGEPARAQAQQLLASIAGQLDFYGLLAAEDLGRVFVLPPRPLPLGEQERGAAVANPGLTRALQLIDIGLRNEGVREWNFTLRGMSDRELLAAAQWACDREVWDRCINTSDRTRNEVDIEQRFPTPFRDSLLAKAREVGVDPAYVYGLIRQESRFLTDARSHVGASGLMQVMPATARWTAQKLGIPYTPEMITHRDTNLLIGTGYLKLVLDDFQGSQALAAAAYNAGPSRARRWREGPVLEPAVWAENVPFNETRDYVKKVLANAVLYSHVLQAGRTDSLRARLGGAIGPRDAQALPPNTELP